MVLEVEGLEAAYTSCCCDSILLVLVFAYSTDPGNRVGRAPHLPGWVWLDWIVYGGFFLST